MRSVRLLQDEGFVSLRDEADIGQGASLVSVFLGAGGMDSRIDGALTLTGTGAFGEMGGALLTSGKQRQECAVAVRHEAEGGSSRQIWRAVAADKSTGKPRGAGRGRAARAEDRRRTVAPRPVAGRAPPR